ncbi:LemA family protein [Providencia manganoxydans]|uniref:LemA family protein n=1 Tax=Providencia manganoxydans TaxID=2923283 RepID=UPI0034DD9902
MSDLLVLILIIALITIFSVRMHNNIIKKYNRMRQAWADVIVQVRQKELVIPKIEKIVNEHKEFESTVLTEITKMRSLASDLDKSPETVSPQTLKNYKDNFDTLFKSIKLTVENYPDLKSINLYRDLANQISEQEDNISAAIRIYNSNVAEFNTSIEEFPNNYINKTFTKKNPGQPFEHEQSSIDIGFTPTF